MSNPTFRLLRCAALLLASGLLGCGADVEPYKPSLGGIINENIDPNAPPQDVSFVDGTQIQRVSDTACTEQAPYFPFSISVSNEYRKRKVRVRLVDASCAEGDGPEVPPGEEVTVGVYARQVIRIVDAADSTLLSSWQILSVNSIKTDRIVLRSTSPDI